MIMNMRDDNPLDLIVAQDEVITLLVVRSTGLADLVNYSLNATSFPGTKPKSEPCVFPVHRSSNLGMTVHYVGDDGGSFSVQATGDRGGDVSVFSANQATGEAFRTIGYMLAIE
jgi:hypothetical protein